MLFVHKYGGTSLADARRLDRAARRSVELARQGHRLVLVVSAQGDHTDRMIEKAAQTAARPSPREMDAYLAAGEQMAAGLMAMAIGELDWPAVSLTGWQAGIRTDGCHGNARIRDIDTGRMQMAAGLMAMAIGELDWPAVSLTGWQAGIRTDGCHGNARIRDIDTGRIRQELDDGKIVVVAGFQGLGPAGDITTLGRGGSDTTAAALAAWLHADQCRIFTDVDGVYDRDPRKDPAAVRLSRIGYSQMLALIDQGAQVLHRPSVEFAQEHRICLEVLSAFTGAPGTLVGDLESL